MTRAPWDLGAAPAGFDSPIDAFVGSSGTIGLLFGFLAGGVALRLWQSRGAVARGAAASAAIASLRASLEVALQRIRLFSESQERFVANLAQEIKVPLASLSVHAEVLLAGAMDSALVQRCARDIACDLRHLSDLVESLLQLGRPFSQHDTSNHVPVHVHDLVLEAVRRCQPLAGARAVSVVPMLAETRGDGSIEVLGDAVLLEAMIENMVRNGLFAAPRGSRVDLDVRIKSDAVVLSVRDHGDGMDENDIEAAIRGAFLAAPVKPVTGNGLGLALARRVAEHHRGTISLRNVPEGGCEFAVRLPRWFPELPPVDPSDGRATTDRLRGRR